MELKIGLAIKKQKSLLKFEELIKFGDAKYKNEDDLTDEKQDDFLDNMER